MSKNGKLALVLPTYRFDEKAKHCIRTLASMGGDDVDVFIGDNSANPDKWAFLYKLASQSMNCHVFCHETNIGGGPNVAFLLKKLNHEFVTQPSDDDTFTPDYYLAGRDLLRKFPDCVAASGLCLTLTLKGQTLEVSMPRSYPQPDALQRISAYNYWQNALCFSVYRAETVKGLDRYFQDRPFWMSYMDQFTAYTLLSSGQYLTDPTKQVFLYNNQHWGTPETASAEDGRYFTAAGLPANFLHLNRVCWAADIVHYFNSTYRPEHLTDEESDAICDNLFTRMFRNEFPNYLMTHTAEIGALFQHAPQQIQLLREIIYTTWRDVRQFLKLFVAILAAFNENVSQRYQAFVDASLLPLVSSRASTIQIDDESRCGLIPAS